MFISSVVVVPVVTDWYGINFTMPLSVEVWPVIKDVLIDLRFRGDYTPESRQKLQKFVAQHNLAAFAAGIRGDDFGRKSRFLRGFKHSSQLFTVLACDMGNHEKNRRCRTRHRATGFADRRSARAVSKIVRADFLR